MASIKVHGFPISTATLRAVTVLHEKNVDFEFVFVDLKSDAHKQPHFLSLNPFGLVPAFEDGDIKIFESRAITKYVATAYESSGTPLLVQQDKKQLASFATWSEVEAHQFDPVAGKLAWELYYKGLFGMEIDNAVAEENEAKLAKVLDVYEARLSQSKYLAGDSFTLVDLHHLPALHYLSGTKAKAIFDARPHVSAWVKDILGRPAWQKAVANA